MRAQTLLVLFAVAGGALAAPLQAPFEVPSTRTLLLQCICWSTDEL